MGEIAGVNVASLGGYLHSSKKGPDGQKGSTMNSTATCSTWRGMSSVRLYFARDSPCDENKQPYNTGLVAARVNKNRAFRRTPGRRYATGASSKIREKHSITKGTWKTKTLRAAGRLQKLTREMDSTDGTSLDFVK